MSKLTLNRGTIRTLQSSELLLVAGGGINRVRMVLEDADLHPDQGPQSMRTVLLHEPRWTEVRESFSGCTWNC